MTNFVLKPYFLVLFFDLTLAYTVVRSNHGINYLSLLTRGRFNDQSHPMQKKKFIVTSGSLSVVFGPYPSTITTPARKMTGNGGGVN